VASDCHALVIHKTEDLFDDEFIQSMPDRFLIHRNHWREISKGFVSLRINDNIIHCFTKTIKNLYPISFENSVEIDKKYVNYTDIIPKMEDIKEIPKIGLNPYLLLKISKAMDLNYGVRIMFHGSERSMLIYPTNAEIDNSSMALLMPISLL
jgi:hypothetical protein